MNSIRAIEDKSEYKDYPDFLNFNIDGDWLDEKIGELYQSDFMYKGTIPTLLFLRMYDEVEKSVIRKRILPEEEELTICPILMCPDDCDFSGIIIVASIENCKTTIRWNRIGVDQTLDWNPNKIGSKVKWLDKVEPFVFDIVEYQNMLNAFEKYSIEEKI